MPWPAHLYANQANPQVTGSQGAYAFLAPPGTYYLQLDGGADYYSYRSPQLQVTSAPLRLNIPLSPRLPAAYQTVLLGPAGPDLPVVHLPLGQSVDWAVGLDSTLTLTQSMSLVDQPQLRLQTSGLLDPLVNPLGWDAGMLAPGNSYRRQFVQAGIYPYTDGAGHSGSVVVDNKLYLPVLRR